MTVPGVVDGWAKLHERWGKLPWRDLFQPAIFYAEQGFPVAEIIHAWGTADGEGSMTNRGEPARVSAGGKVPETARSFAIPMWLVRSRLIAEQGEAAFYKGEIAKAILKTSRRSGRDDDGRRSCVVLGRVG